MNVNIESSWKQALAREFTKDYFAELSQTVKNAYLTDGPVYPPPKLIFNAFTCCPLTKLRVVILGQDPYHGPGQAHGLAFSVNDGVPTPPSLQNIYAEIANDVGTPAPPSGNLKRWATQGVLLLNSTLTVKATKAGSHQSFGWEQFTDAVIKTIAREKKHVVFLLWGAFAGGKASFIDETKHLILRAPHPSPLSAHRGFFGCRHFSQCNEYLKNNGQKAIVW